MPSQHRSHLVTPATDKAHDRDLRKRGQLMRPQNPMAITVAEFCRKYQIHRSTFYRNAKRGAMPPIVKIGSASRILYDDEQRWLSTLRGEDDHQASANLD